MILRKTGSGIPKSYIFNAAAGLVMLGTLAYAVRTSLLPEDVPQCSERYSNATRFALQRSDGSVLTATDLQARLGGRDWGLLDNAKIVKVKNGPSPTALQVALPKGSPRSGDDTVAKSGLGFRWLSGRLAGAAAACLTYDVFLPQDFEFGPGGSLPGLFGGPVDEHPQQPGRSGFSAPYRWQDDAKAAVRTVTTEHPQGTSIAIDPDRFKLERGRWTRLEQEVVLNTPGNRDGILRVWVNGALRLDRAKLTLRADDKTVFSGVAADVHYGRSDLSWAAAPKDTSVLLSPFELRWR